MALKFCINCKWLEETEFPKHAKCMHTLATNKHAGYAFDAADYYVTGERPIESHYEAAIMRLEKSKCGPEGKLFEAK